MVLLALLVGCATASSPPQTTTGAAKRAGKSGVDSCPNLETQRFSLALRQDGAEVPIVDHKAVLARGPFDLVMCFRDLTFVALHASTRPDVFQAAAAHQPLTTSTLCADGPACLSFVPNCSERCGKLVRDGGLAGLFDGARFMAAHDGNRYEDLVLADDAVSTFHYASPTDNRCSEGRVLPNGVVYCRRRVANLSQRYGGPVELAQQAPETVYLVGMALADVHPDSLVMRELQRAYVAMRFGN